MTLLEMLVLAALTRQSWPSSSTLTVRFSVMYRQASLYSTQSIHYHYTRSDVNQIYTTKTVIKTHLK